jgi:hypothetical protein
MNGKIDPPIANSRPISTVDVSCFESAPQNPTPVSHSLPFHALSASWGPSRLSSSTVIFPTGIGQGGTRHLPYAKSDSNTLRKVLEKRVDAGENRRAQKSKAMLRTLTIVLMTSPSRGSAFYFRRREGERYDRIFFRCRDTLTRTHVEPSRLLSSLFRTRCA